MKKAKTNVNVRIDGSVWNRFTYLRKEKPLSRDQAIEIAIEDWNKKEEKNGKG